MRCRCLVPLLGVLFIVALVASTWPFLESVPTTASSEADAVVALAGVDARTATAVALADDGVSSTLVLSYVPGAATGAVEARCAPAPVPGVECPVPDPVATHGEARALADLAAARGWTSLVVVTSRAHVPRARTLIGQCFDGDVKMVTLSEGSAERDFLKYLREWVALYAAMSVRRAC